MKTKNLYVGTKLVKALAITREDYNKYRGWELPEDENGADFGLLVECIDGGAPNHPNHEGYISWSPQEVFENAYRASGHLDFGAAVELLKRGYTVARSGWNGSDMFLYYVPANTYPAQTEAAKTLIGEQVPYSAYIAMKTAQGNVVPWLASQMDILAEDWLVVE